MKISPVVGNPLTDVSAGPIELMVFVMLTGFFVAAVALSRRPSRARLSSLLAGVSVGGFLSCFLVAGLFQELTVLGFETAGFLAKMGLPWSFVFPWCTFCVVSGVLFTGMTIGGWLGWWMRSDRVR